MRPLGLRAIAIHTAFHHPRASNQALAPAFAAGLGALHVCDLATAAPQDAELPSLLLGQPPDALCIFVTQLLTDAHGAVLAALAAHPWAKKVAVFSSLSEAAHAGQARSFLGVEAFGEYAALLWRQVSARCSMRSSQ